MLNVSIQNAVPAATPPASVSDDNSSEPEKDSSKVQSVFMLIMSPLGFR